jgi:hypothetical protein
MRFFYAGETSQELLLWVILGAGIGQLSTYLITILSSLRFSLTSMGGDILRSLLAAVGVNTLSYCVWIDQRSISRSSRFKMTTAATKIFALPSVDRLTHVCILIVSKCKWLCFGWISLH